MAEQVSILYLAGARRSGTTLLSRILNELPEVAAVGEVYFFANGDVCGCDRMPEDCPVWAPISRAAEQLGGRDVFRAGVERLQMRNIVGAVRPSSRAAMFAELDDFGELLRTIYGMARESLGARLIVDESKHPLFGAFVASQDWAEVRFVRLLRDPLAVTRSYAASKSHAKVPSRTVSGRSPRWAASHYLVQNLGAGWVPRATGRPFLSVRFEDLAADPEGTVCAITDFAGVAGTNPVHDRTFFAGGNHILASNPDKHDRGEVAIRSSSHGPTEGMPWTWRAASRSMNWPARRLYGYHRTGSRDPAGTR